MTEAQECYAKIMIAVICLDVGIDMKKDLIIMDCLNDFLLFHLSIEDFVR